MTEIPPFAIRTARPADAVAIILVHFGAVHAIDPELYSPDILKAWSPEPDEPRYNWMRQLTRQGKDIVVVAENESLVLGFGIVSPTLRELRAMYVQPAASGRGIGKQILHELETRVLAQGVSRLQLNASLNAEAFYQHNGYKSLLRSTLRLSNEHEMVCIRMEKDF